MMIIYEGADIIFLRLYCLFYSMGLIISYVILMVLAEIGILRKKYHYLPEYSKYMIDTSPYTPGVSIVASAYNEERTIVDNVNSLLSQDYPCLR